MNYKRTFSYALSAAVMLCAISSAAATCAQEPAETKPVVVDKKGGRDPFKKYEAERKFTKAAAAKLEVPTIQMRIERYRAQKQAAAAAHIAPPKPTTALLLNEMQVIGIFRTPRGFAAMVEATPFSPKLSYVIYPGETFFDGQLVAIEESRLVFRRDVVWTDGRHEKTIEAKPRRLLTELDTGRLSKHLVVFKASGKAVDDLMEKARAGIPGLTDASAVHRVLQHNPDCMIAIARKRKFNLDDPVGDGFFAFLPLNKTGLFQLATNTLDTRNPDVALLAGPNERPAGIYVWATYAPGPLAAGVALVLEQVETPNYAGVDLYSRPNTPAGFRLPSRARS